MNVKELITELQNIGDQEMQVYKIDEDGNFIPLSQEDVSDVELGDSCDEEGNLTDLDEYPELNGMHVLCVNWENV